MLVRPILLGSNSAMGKRLRRSNPICSCASPRSSFLSPHSPFSCYEEDIWTEIAKYLDAKSVVMLATTCKWFYGVVTEDIVWKYAFLRDFQVPDPGKVAFKWRKLYASAVDGSHTYLFRQQEKHIDWARVGAFFFSSSSAILMDKVEAPKITLHEDSIGKTLNEGGFILLSNVKNGIWIADLQLVRCPVCDLNTCDGTMQILDARHIELFLHKCYQDGIWDYTLLGSRDIKKNVEGACGAIVDHKHLKDASSAELFDGSWQGSPEDWHPKTKVTCYAAAVNTNLQENEGIQVKYHVMRTGDEGKAVAIRISQQLL